MEVAIKTGLQYTDNNKSINEIKNNREIQTNLTKIMSSETLNRLQKNDDFIVADISDEAKKIAEQIYKGKEKLNECTAAEHDLEAMKDAKDAANKCAEDIAKIMTVFRLMMKGDTVPLSDEKKLAEYDKEMYLSAKTMQTMAQQRQRGKNHKSLWDEEDESIKFEKPQNTEEGLNFTNPSYRECQNIFDIHDSFNNVTNLFHLDIDI